MIIISQTLKPPHLERRGFLLHNEKEHHLILVQLGILDDMEDWPLYQGQQNKYFKLLDEVGHAQYDRYVIHTRTYDRK